MNLKAGSLINKIEKSLAQYSAKKQKTEVNKTGMRELAFPQIV